MRIPTRISSRRARTLRLSSSGPRGLSLWSPPFSDGDGRDCSCPAPASLEGQRPLRRQKPPWICAPTQMGFIGRHHQPDGARARASLSSRPDPRPGSPAPDLVSSVRCFLFQGSSESAGHREQVPASCPTRPGGQRRTQRPAAGLDWAPEPSRLPRCSGDTVGVGPVRPLRRRSCPVGCRAARAAPGRATPRPDRLFKALPAGSPAPTPVHPSRATLKAGGNCEAVGQPEEWSLQRGDTMLFFALLLEVTGILAADGGHHWTYEGPHGQDHWPDSYPECGSSAQSPIDIQTDCVTFDPELPALRLHGYEQPGVEPLDLHNNGHTVQLSLPPTLELGGLPRKYVAAQLHLHWGQKGSPGGSEHQINSEATAAELHIVHYDSDSYSSLNEAAHRPLGLAVLGVLIEVGETENPAYEHILSHLHEVSHKDQTTSVPPFSVRELLPPQLEQFFRYNGSLTTPPCYQSVLWTVFNRRAQISVGQLERLQQTLFSTEEEPSEALVQNYRAPQPLNQRTVVASFAQVGPLYTTGEMLSLGVGILLGCLCLLLAVYFIARKIRKKRLGNRKSVVFTSAGATREA